ncbi:MAG: adenylate kinase [Myxococcales bacterium]|nr:adenylate kinase [Myxococcales bacterium]
MNLIFLGAPGSGKGTQAEILVERHEIPQISTGDMLRLAIRHNEPFGREAKKYINRGDLVPDDLVIQIVEQRLGQPDCRQGFILDGFPRTVAQANALEQVLGKDDRAIDVVINLCVDEGELLKRLTGRRVCSKCGTMYHLSFNPPENEGRCDRCGGRLFQRDDDQEDTIRARFEVYQEQTAPLIAYYQEKSVLRTIKGTGGAREIADRIAEVLKEIA